MTNELKLQFRINKEILLLNAAETVLRGKDCSQIISDAIPIPGAVPENEICHTESATSLHSLDSGTGSRSGSLSEDPVSELDEAWIPHCFVKSKSKEFIGCTSISEAFHRLDLARGVSDVRRFGYIAKVRTCS
ncbi:hypothetical protein GCK32_009514 [Trichostrongylus colubriformis]|uniref:Uncharacterized protein n=1 Tax=Trichostrongylus colubriformis TaxID=6319 RepID=A0AAN8FKQ3_TRICO